MKNFKRFVKAACYTSDPRNDLNRADVPTWEEYVDNNERVSNYLEELSSRIAALENKDVKDEEKITMHLWNPRGNSLELEGTEEQLEAFDAERRERNDALFPRALSLLGIINLALEHGLSIKRAK